MVNNMEEDGILLQVGSRKKENGMKAKELVGSMKEYNDLILKTILNL
jgi:hypothetical protein